ncbi:hypothetical protein AC062_2163 [Pasteurellaceae bacterium NI1060]|nr:hypothetical protein AC062_2163 [Pasteurellaceae bacterium NI1060]
MLSNACFPAGKSDFNQANIRSINFVALPETSDFSTALF